MFYSIVLTLHNLARWAVLILLILATVRAYLGWSQKREWTPRDRKIGLFTGIALDIQFLLGLLLYVFLSPLTRSAFQDFGAAMAVADLRYYAVEHIFYMLLALVFVHLGSIQARKAAQKGDPATASVRAHRQAALWFTLALLLVLTGIPWGRPLFRLPMFG